MPGAFALVPRRSFGRVSDSEAWRQCLRCDGLGDCYGVSR
jgi:hypothetical protein